MSCRCSTHRGSRPAPGHPVGGISVHPSSLTPRAFLAPARPRPLGVSALLQFSVRSAWRRLCVAALCVADALERFRRPCHRLAAGSPGRHLRADVLESSRKPAPSSLPSLRSSTAHGTSDRLLRSGESTSFLRDESSWRNTSFRCAGSRPQPLVSTVRHSCSGSLHSRLVKSGSSIVHSRQMRRVDHFSTPYVDFLRGIEPFASIRLPGCRGTCPRGNVPSGAVTMFPGDSVCLVMNSDPGSVVEPGGPV